MKKPKIIGRTKEGGPVYEPVTKPTSFTMKKAGAVIRKYLEEHPRA